jgi:hypothetical protein
VRIVPERVCVCREITDEGGDVDKPQERMRICIDSLDFTNTVSRPLGAMSSIGFSTRRRTVGDDVLFTMSSREYQ